MFVVSDLARGFQELQPVGSASLKSCQSRSRPCSGSSCSSSSELPPDPKMFQLISPGAQLEELIRQMGGHSTRIDRVSRLYFWKTLRLKIKIRNAVLRLAKWSGKVEAVVEMKSKPATPASSLVDPQILKAVVDSLPAVPEKQLECGLEIMKSAFAQRVSPASARLLAPSHRPVVHCSRDVSIALSAAPTNPAALPPPPHPRHRESADNCFCSAAWLAQLVLWRAPDALEGSWSLYVCSLGYLHHRTPAPPFALPSSCPHHYTAALATTQLLRASSAEGGHLLAASQQRIFIQCRQIV